MLLLQWYFNSFKKIVKVSAKVLVIFTVCFSVITLFLYIIKGDNKKISFSAEQERKNESYAFINDPANQKTQEGRTQVFLFRSTLCVLTGETCTANPADGVKNYNSSIFGMTNNLLALPYNNPPASGIYTIQNTIASAGLIPKAQAYEGIGLASIKGYGPVWTLFRNLTYLILVLAVIILGFLIMFRVKLDPHTVIAFENSLPRIVITILLITFSFTIAGLLIDAMFSIITMSIYFLAQTNVGALNVDNMANLQNQYLGANMSTLFPVGFGDNPAGPNGGVVENIVNFSPFKVGGAFFNVLPSLVQFSLKGVISFGSGYYIAKAMSTPVTDFMKIFSDTSFSLAGFGIGVGSTVTIIGWIVTLVTFLAIVNFLPGVIIGIILSLTLLVLIARIFGILLMSYIKIILLIIFSPVIILGEVLPGKNAFMGWLKGLISELIAFPVVIIISLIGNLVININNGPPPPQLTPGITPGIEPGSIGQVGTDLTNHGLTLPFLHGFSPEDFSVILGMGIVLLIPDIIKTVKKAIGTQDLPFNMGLGTFFGGVGALGGVKGALQGAPSLFHNAPKGFREAVFGKKGQERSFIQSALFGHKDSSSIYAERQIEQMEQQAKINVAKSTQGQLPTDGKGGHDNH